MVSTLKLWSHQHGLQVACLNCKNPLNGWFQKSKFIHSFAIIKMTFSNQSFSARRFQSSSRRHPDRKRPLPGKLLILSRRQCSSPQLQRKWHPRIQVNIFDLLFQPNTFIFLLYIKFVKSGFKAFIFIHSLFYECFKSFFGGIQIQGRVNLSLK